MKRGDKWCVIHCHGADAGKAIKCFDTEGAAQAMHRAIQANKGEALKVVVREDGRPPKVWWDNCTSSLSGKADDPAALCNWIWHNRHETLTEAYRHRDFQRIHDEFVSYYKDSERGESEYYSWLQALSLDEGKEYGQAQESFKWAKNMFQYLREDDQYKYYKVLVGFPVKSMNGNVYKERDLVAATLTLKGVHPNLNHKNKWHFTPESRWGEITVADARFEDGAAEAIVKVSKKAVCPICDGKPMTELIDNKRIVNVSLQGGCAAQSYTGVCDGFQFDDKGFSLLTSDVLPGIPMARIFPLESIMVEALQKVDETKTDRRRKKVTKLVMEVLEEDDGPRTDAERAKAHFNISDEEWNKLSDEEKQAYIDKLPEHGSAGEQLTQVLTVDAPVKPAVEPDAQGQCPEGMRLNALGKCVETEDCGEGRHWDANANEGQGGCVDDTPPEPAGPETAIGSSPAPREDVLTMGPLEQPTPGEQPPITDKPISKTMPVAGEEPTVTMHAPEDTGELPLTSKKPPDITPDLAQEEPAASPHECPPDHHYVPGAVPPCVPDHPAVEKKKRVQAENKAKSLEGYVANLEDKLVKYDDAYKTLSVNYQNQDKRVRELQSEARDLNEKRLKLQGDLNERDRETGRLHNQIKEMQHQLDELKDYSDGLGKKYEKAVGVNLELSRKNVKANEDYLEAAVRIEHLEAQLKKAKDIGKKIYRIKV